MSKRGACIHPSIGMDGSTLVRSLSGNTTDEAQDRLKDLHSRYYKEAPSLLRSRAGACKLLDRVAALSLKVVLANVGP